MPMLIVVDRDGREREVQGEAGLNVMEVIRGAGYIELLALCGGCCSCATCHVHVDAADLPRLPPIGRDEDDLLDACDTRDERSRLSCQVVFEEELDGIRVTIAEED